MVRGVDAVQSIGMQTLNFDSFMHCSEGKIMLVLLMEGDEEKLKDQNGHMSFEVDESVLHSVGAKFFEVVQKCGEVLFVPSGWHHQVWNLVSWLSFCQSELINTCASVTLNFFCHMYQQLL